MSLSHLNRLENNGLILLTLNVQNNVMLRTQSRSKKDFFLFLVFCSFVLPQGGGLASCLQGNTHTHTHSLWSHRAARISPYYWGHASSAEFHFTDSLMKSREWDLIPDLIPDEQRSYFLCQIILIILKLLSLYPRVSLRYSFHYQNAVESKET